LYNGVDESYSNYNVNDGVATMYIDIVGYDTFTIYVRSNAESNYDYVTVYNLDSTSSAKMTTKGNQQSGTSISSYTPVTFSNIGGGSHRITVKYSKDSSQHSGADRGYLIIPKNH
jgi:type IV secretory pathway ATPase VirB11/archaellum biosynthesis ATPase